MMRRQHFTCDRSSVARLVGIAALACVLSACGGGGGGGGGSYGSSGSNGTSSGGSGGSGGVPPTTLNCNGYPQQLPPIINGGGTQVCLLLPVEFAKPATGVSISAKSGNITAHGTGPSDLYPVYARVIAQDADEGKATALARNVVVTLGLDGTISASPDHADSPQSLNIDFEVFTAPSTNLTFSSETGNQQADHYNATLKLAATSGNTILDTVQGSVNVNTTAGNVDITLTGTGWSGAGLTASTQSGNITLTRPASYQAAFTAQTNTGTATIDDKSVTSPPGPGPAKVTAGSGTPIALQSGSGNVDVKTAM